MMTIDHQVGLYAPITTSSPSPRNPGSQAKEQAPKESSTVHLSGNTAQPSAPTYSRPSGLPSPTATLFSEVGSSVRELTPVSAHPKALMASRTFLDIAYFDGGPQLLDVYA